MKIEWKSCFKVGLSTFLLFLAIYYWKGLTDGLSMVFGAAGPLFMGGIMAYLLNIPMSFYERHFFPRSDSRMINKCRRVFCLIAAILTLLGIAAGVVGLVIPELIASVRLLVSWIPAAVSRVTDFVADSESLAEIIPPEYLQKLESVNWEEWVAKIVQFLSTGISGAVGTAVGAITSVFSSVVAFLCGTIFAFYLLIGKERLKRQAERLARLYLPVKYRKKLDEVLPVVNNCFHRYVVGQCTEAVILGGLCIVGMLILRLPYATMIGTLIGFTALIPVAGAYIGAFVGTFMILTVSPVKAVIFAVFLCALQQVEGNLIYPRVVGTSIGLPGMWVLAAVTVGGGILGIPGMMIGVPMAAAVYRLVREDVRKREAKERKENDRRHREKRQGKAEVSSKDFSSVKRIGSSGQAEEAAERMKADHPAAQEKRKTEQAKKLPDKVPADRTKQGEKSLTEKAKPGQGENGKMSSEKLPDAASASRQHRRRRRHKPSEGSGQNYPPSGMTPEGKGKS